MKSRTGPIKLSLVLPVFNESLVLPATYESLRESFNPNESTRCEFIFVDDGSDDNSSEIIRDWINRDSRVRLVKLSRNFGHQAALDAGLSAASGDVVGVLDADLQDPPHVILEMLSLWREGYDVVFGVREARKEGLLKRVAYASFYRLWRRLAAIDVPLDSGDFCLIDRKVLEEINRLPEANRFFRGLRSWAGFRQVGLPYERALRARGESKYSFRALVNLSLDGLIDFSVSPLKLISLVGLLLSGGAFLGLILLLVQRIIGFSIFGSYPEDVPGWTSIAVAILLICGVQLLATGVLGLYIGRTYQEAKARPSFVVETVYGFDNTEWDGDGKESTLN